jgi:transglutaminase-like putative cysteine protease
LWNEGEQRVLSSGPGTSTIEVTARDIPPTAATWQLPHPDTPELHPYLQASAYLEVNAPEIQALARQAVGTEKNPVRAAHRIERFVRAYITKKDLNIGFASAEETAKSREGDCTEHAVLCAAIGRAAGLPTRCVLGFGYIPPGVDEPTVGDAKGSDTGIFGFHMWAEAWIGPDEWVPMDAALDGFDVGHIAITKTALEEINPLADLNLPILQLMQDLKIDVLKTVPKAPLH